MKRLFSTISFERVFQSADSWGLFIDFNEICKIWASKENDFVYSERKDTLWHRSHAGLIQVHMVFMERKKKSTSCNTQCHCTISNILKNGCTFNKRVIVLRLPFIGQSHQRNSSLFLLALCKLIIPSYFSFFFCKRGCMFAASFLSQS